MTRAVGRHKQLSSDAGSMIPLVLGMVVITTLLITVVTDVATMWLARRSLQATVDGAALAGSRAVDLAAIYAGQSRGSLRLNASEANMAVRDYLAASPSSHQLNAFRITTIQIMGATIHIQAEAVVRPPFVSLLGSHNVVIAAQASAETITR